jgi:cellulose synthase operon protein C
MISVRGVLLWFVALSISGYFLGAAGLAYWFHKKPFNRVSYADLVLPWRWSQLETLRGQANIDQAEDEIKNGNYRAAFAFLRTGLARYPDDAEARLKLANMFIAIRLRAEAEKTLINAFDHAYPGGDYLKAAVGILEASDNPEFLITFCDRGRAALSARNNGWTPDARFLDGIKVKVLFNLNRPDEAVALVEKYYSTDFEFLTMARVARAISHKNLAAAEAELAAWLAARPNSELALIMAVRVYRAAAKGPELQAAILRLRSRYPREPAHISLALSASLQLGQVQEALDLLDLSVIRFADKPAAYVDWAEAIAESGNDAALARLEQLVTETNQNPQSVIYTRMMAQISRQAWAEAEASSARLEAFYPKVSPRMQALHNVAKALLETCSQPLKGAENTLANTVTGGWVSLQFYVRIVDILARSERYKVALEVITLAEGYYPTSRYLALKRTELTPKLEAQIAGRVRALDETIPSNASETVIPPDAPALFAKLDSLAAAGQGGVSEALRISGAVRKAAPPWLQDVIPELEWREVLLAAQADNTPLLQINLRAFLRGAAPAQLKRALAQAETWFNAQSRNHAVLVVREVLKVAPGHPVATRLLEAWSPGSGTADSTSVAGRAVPEAGAVDATEAVPASAEILFKTIDAMDAEARAEEALRLLRAVRKAEPSWLGAALPGIEWREILLAARADDLSLLQIHLRTYLRGRPENAERVLTQAKGWQADGRKSAALLAVREILRQQANNEAAQELLREWSVPQAQTP